MKVISGSSAVTDRRYSQNSLVAALYERRSGNHFEKRYRQTFSVKSRITTSFQSSRNALGKCLPVVGVRNPPGFADVREIPTFD